MYFYLISQSLCIDDICLYMIESLCLISAKVSLLHLNDRYLLFSCDEKSCTIQSSPKVHFFSLFDFEHLKILIREIFFAKLRHSL
jgi:hypothetical protein